MTNFHDSVIDATLSYAIDLVRKWFAAGELQGENWRVGNIRGEPGDSLSIDTKNGKWRDFASPDQKGGNLVSLYAAIHGIDYKDAIKGVADDLKVLGWRAPTHGSDSGKKKDLQAVIPVPSDAPKPDLREGMPFPGKLDYLLKKWWEYRTAEGELMFYVARFDHQTKVSGKGKPDKMVVPYSFLGSEQGWSFKGIGGKRKNPLYGLPALASRPEAPVLLAEGEKACDAAAELFPDHVAMTWPGGVGQIGKADFSCLNNRSVTFWPDADEAGERSTTVMTDTLRAAGIAELHVVKLPIGFPTSWDLADPAPVGVNLHDILRAAKPVDFAQVKPFHLSTSEELIERLLYTAGTEQFIDLPTGLRFATSQIDALFRHIHEKKGKVSSELLSDPKLIKVVGLAYRPGIEERIIVDGNGCRMFNTWRPSDVVAVPGDATFFEEHLRYLCSSDEEFELLTNCFAFMVQHPGEKLMFAPVLIGEQGTGKSAVATIMRQLLGTHNTTIASTFEVRSNFNEWAIEKELVVIEEIMALGRVEFMNVLKPLITELRLPVNIKHLRRYEIENKANFLFLSNYEDALKLESGDRRYFVISSDKPPRPADYYIKFFKKVNEGLGVILHWLQSRDLSGFNPNERPPLTAGKRTMIELSKDPCQRLIEEMVAEREFPFEHDLVEIKRVWSALAGLGGAAVGTRLARPALQKYLMGVGGKPLGQKKATIKRNMVRYSLWAVRDFERYSAMSGQSLIEQYLQDQPEFNEL